MYLNYFKSLFKKRNFGINIILLLVSLIFIPIQAQNNEWKTAKIAPGSKEIDINATPNFLGFFTVETYFQRVWFRRKDTKRKSKMNIANDATIYIRCSDGLMAVQGDKPLATGPWPRTNGDNSNSRNPNL